MEIEAQKDTELKLRHIEDKQQKTHFNHLIAEPF